MGKKLSIKNIGIDKLLLLGLAGVVLVIVSIPFSNDKKTTDSSDSLAARTQSKSQESSPDYESELEKRVEDILSNIEGVGKVDVMITIKDSGEKIVDSAKPYSKSETSESDSTGGSRTITEITQSDDTIFSVDENGNNIPYVTKELQPQIEGIAVIAQGGGNAVIAEKITNVLESLLNVSVNKISVMKMKS